MSLLWEVQRSAVARWRTWPGLAAVGDRFYDFVAPQDTALPYAVVGDSSMARVSVFGEWVGRVGFPVKVVTDDAGHDHSPAFEIVFAMGAALAEPLNLNGYASARLKVESEAKLVERDGDRIYRIVQMRYTLVTVES